MGKPLNCDETLEIRTILKHIHEIVEEARETNSCGNGNELSHMVSRYLPCVEKSYKYFVERSVFDD